MSRAATQYDSPPRRSIPCVEDTKAHRLREFLLDPLHESLVSLRRILRVTDIQSKSLAKECGLTTSKLLVLQFLDEEGEATIGKISEVVSLTQATITILIDRLQEAGLVERERSTSDRRKVYVSLTDDGRSAVAQAPMALHERFAQSFNNLEDWEQMQIAAVLKRLSVLLGAERIDAAPVLDIGSMDRNP